MAFAAIGQKIEQVRIHMDRVHNIVAKLLHSFISTVRLNGDEIWSFSMFAFPKLKELQWCKVRLKLSLSGVISDPNLMQFRWMVVEK